MPGARAYLSSARSRAAPPRPRTEAAGKAKEAQTENQRPPSFKLFILALCALRLVIFYVC